MADFNELLKKRIVYEIAGMEQSRVAKNRVYKTVEEIDLLLVSARRCVVLPHLSSVWLPITVRSTCSH